MTDEVLHEASGVGDPLPSALLHQMLDLVQESVIVRGSDGSIRYWNRASETVYGWTSTQALGHSHDVLLDTRTPHSLKAIEELVKARGSWDGEVLRRTAGGQERRIELRWILRQGGHAAANEIIEYGRDVTSLTELEIESRLAAHRYRNLFQAMAASFWELDFGEVRRMIGGLLQSGVTDLAAHFDAHPEFIDAAIAATRVVDVNDKTVEMFGAGDRDELVGGSADPFWPTGSRPVYAGALLAAAARRPNYATETRLRRLDGHEFDVLFTVCWPPGHEGRGSVLVGVIDISGRKAAEARQRQADLQYRTLFHALPVALFQMDTLGAQALLGHLRAAGVDDLAVHLDRHPDLVSEAMALTRVVDVNDAAARMFAAPDRAAMIGLTSTPFWPPSGQQTFRRLLEAAFRQEPGLEAETRMRRLDGTEIDVHFFSHAPPELRAQGRVVSVVIDIGDRLAAEDAMQQLRAEFAHAARLSVLGELAASIAHEVNQPLAAIAANGAAGTRWLARPEPDLGEVRAAHERIVADARRAADIIGRMRRMAAKQAPDRSTTELNALVEESILFLRHELQSGKVAVRLDLAPDLPSPRVDRTQIQQVIVNLVLNAVQEMAQAEVSKPELIVRTRAGDDGELCVEIEDRGGGIAVETADRLFESFFTTKRDGLGIGLAICRSIVEAHGGSIRAENRPNGACFAFTLPGAAG